MKKAAILFLFVPALLLSCAKKPLSPHASEFPQRIVALSPSAAEILFAVGAGSQVVAVSEFTDYPPEATALPVVGGFDGKTLSTEKILSFRPDFVYLTDGMHNFLIPQLEQYEIPYYLSKGDSLASVMAEILEIGSITGHGDQADISVAKIAAQLEAVAPPQTPVRVYWEVWNSPYMSAGSSSFINDVIRAAGGQNIFSDVPDAYPIVSEESILVRKPDVILIAQTSGQDAVSVRARTGWQEIPAVQDNHVFIVDDNLASRPGPRIGEVVLLLNDLFSGAEQYE